MKDNFSSKPDQYAKFRPAYPETLFDFLKTLGTGKANAWDCGTGNGQVASRLAEYFDNVFATDISAGQLQNAVQKPNITYSLQPAEKTNFPDASFDLIVVAQAVHWFDFEQFYAEVKRTAKPGAHLVITGYGLFQLSPGIDAIIADFYSNIIGKYWDNERKYIDDLYQTIPFPFTEVEVPSLSHEMEWTLEHLLGYLGTWSAVKHFEKATGRDPVQLISEALAKSWGPDQTRKVRFPVLLRIGSL